MKARLEEFYENNLRSSLLKDLGLKNIMEVPRLSKIVLNMGVKDAITDSKVLNLITEIISDIAGQAAVRTYAKKSIAGFKLREGMPIGVMVTLRRKNMYDFLDRLINLSLPRVKDFHGLELKFDGQGNFNLGIKDWMIFPEVEYEKIDKSRGLNITIQTTAKTDKPAEALLRGFGLPFKKVNK